MPGGGYHILKNLVINPLVFPNSLFGGCPRTLFQPPQSPNHGGSLYWGTPPKPPAGRILHFFSDSLKEGDLKLGGPPPRPPKSPLNQRFLSRRDFAARFFQRGLTPKNMVLMMKPNIPSGLNFD